MQTEVWDKGGDGVRFTVRVDEEPVFTQYIDPKQYKGQQRWHDFEVNLSEYAGQQVKITFLVAPNKSYAWDWAVWAEPQIVVRDADSQP
jgi:hypothetical protein